MLTIKDFRKPHETWDVSDPLVYTPHWGGDSPLPIWNIGSCTFYPVILENELISSNAIPEKSLYACWCHPTKTRESICHVCCGSGAVISYNYLRSIVNEHS